MEIQGNYPNQEIANISKAIEQLSQSSDKERMLNILLKDLSRLLSMVYIELNPRLVNMYIEAKRKGLC